MHIPRLHACFSAHSFSSTHGVAHRFGATVPVAVTVPLFPFSATTKHWRLSPQSAASLQTEPTSPETDVQRPSAPHFNSATQCSADSQISPTFALRTHTYFSLLQYRSAAHELSSSHFLPTSPRFMRWGNSRFFGFFLPGPGDLGFRMQVRTRWSQNVDFAQSRSDRHSLPGLPIATRAAMPVEEERKNVQRAARRTTK
jgi:hypothetical protein